MAYINPAIHTLTTCFQSRYSLPYFQRDYKWETRHFLEMLNDIQEAFLLEYDPSHGRRNVSSYKPYFLGSIITSAEDNGKKPLIDGQQRVTSLFIIMAFFKRCIHDLKIANAPEVNGFIGSVKYGETDYNIEFSEGRKAIFDTYLDLENLSSSVVYEKLEEIADLSDSDKRIIASIRLIDENLNADIKKNLAFFIDYFIEKVLLIDISVATESEAHRVFVTMNDRGLRLGAIELLKGFLLSKITVAENSQEAHVTWMDTMTSLRNIDTDGDSLFFRNLFRGKWATSIRGKNKGDQAGDFDLIGDAYHRWFEDKVEAIGLTTSDDYYNFVNKDIKFYADIYKVIDNSENKFSQSHKDLFYNGVRKFSFQQMIMLSVVSSSEPPVASNKKLSLVAKYIDVILTSRIITGKANTYDNLKDLAFTITKEIRGKSYQDLLAHIQAEWGKYSVHMDDIPKLSYEYSSRGDMLYILARIAEFIEVGLQLANKVGFDVYMQRDKNQKTFDIEHIFRKELSANLTSATLGFASDAEYSVKRNLIGGLILLPRSRNRSLSDKTYVEKLGAYGSENVLCQTLSNNFYVSNPALARFKAKYPDLNIKEYADFSLNAINERGELYKEIAKKIWAKPLN